MFYRQSHGRDGLSSARIASVIVMRRAHNPIDFSACMMSFRIFKKIGKQQKIRNTYANFDCAVFLKFG